MKNVVKFIVIALTVSVFVALIWWFVRKRKQEAYERANLNGMTAKEFFEHVRPEWEKTYKQWTKGYIDDMPLGFTDENNAYHSYQAGDPVPTIGEVKNKNWSVYTNNWKSAVFQQAMDKGTSYNTERDATVEYSWDNNEPNPMGHDHARLYWLPTVIDNLNLDWNNELVQKLLYEI